MLTRLALVVLVVLAPFGTGQTILNKGQSVWIEDVGGPWTISHTVSHGVDRPEPAVAAETDELAELSLPDLRRALAACDDAGDPIPGPGWPRVAELLRSERAYDVDAGAYLVGKHGRTELVPELLAAWDRRSGAGGATKDHGCDRILDALVRLDVDVHPERLLADLGGSSAVAAVVLAGRATTWTLATGWGARAARDPGHSTSLERALWRLADPLAVARRVGLRDGSEAQWAALELLAILRAPGLADVLVQGWQLRACVSLHEADRDPRSTTGYGCGFGGGGGGSWGVSHPSWPASATYRIGPRVQGSALTLAGESALGWQRSERKGGGAIRELVDDDDVLERSSELLAKLAPVGATLPEFWVMEDLAWTDDEAVLAKLAERRVELRRSAERYLSGLVEAGQLTPTGHARGLDSLTVEVHAHDARIGADGEELSFP